MPRFPMGGMVESGALFVHGGALSGVVRRVPPLAAGVFDQARQRPPEIGYWRASYISMLSARQRGGSLHTPGRRLVSPAGRRPTRGRFGAARCGVRAIVGLLLSAGGWPRAAGVALHLGRRQLSLRVGRGRRSTF